MVKFGELQKRYKENGEGKNASDFLKESCVGDPRSAKINALIDAFDRLPENVGGYLDVATIITESIKLTRESLEAEYDDLDKDDDGRLDVFESVSSHFKDGWEKFGDLRERFKLLNDVRSASDFLKEACAADPEVEEIRKQIDSFNRFDVKKKGYLEISMLVDLTMNQKAIEIERDVNSLDRDRDGKLDVFEFVSFRYVDSW
ncbi:hypothetical protein [Streptomyces sp. NPDC090112]|uniref:hypothetical protein n=1 Tax=Streptomyces sp. NPDC090112 TaxID=3365949 RepID=UPI0037FC7D13